MWTPPNSCRDCGAEVIWGYTEHGRRMPIDPAVYPRDDERANLAIYTDHLRRVRVRVLARDRPLEGFEHRGMPHVASCPAAAAVRAAKAAARTTHPSSRDRGRRRPEPPALFDASPRAAVADELAARRRARASP